MSSTYPLLEYLWRSSKLINDKYEVEIHNMYSPNVLYLYSLESNELSKILRTTTLRSIHIKHIYTNISLTKTCFIDELEYHLMKGINELDELVKYHDERAKPLDILIKFRRSPSDHFYITIESYDYRISVSISNKRYMISNLKKGYYEFKNKYKALKKQANKIKRDHKALMKEIKMTPNGMQLQIERYGIDKVFKMHGY